MSSPSGGSRVGSLLLHDGAIWTGLNSPKAQAMAIMDGVIVEVGTNQHILDKYGNSYQKEHIVNLCGRTVVPGLIDSHLHVIREGMHFNMELRWDGVKSLAQGLQMIKEQAKRTPKGQWIRVVGGWNEHQFIEKRLPTIAELDVAGGDHPVFVLHLYDCALVNRIGLSILGYTAQTPNPPSGEIQRDEQGNPTGVLIARPNAFLLYNTLNILPKLDHEQAKNSTLAYVRELHRFGVTSVLDPGGGFQNYPNDYKVIQELDSEEKLTLRIHYSLFPQKPKKELEDFQRWAKMVSPGQGSAFLRHLGAGEMLAFTAADFEDFKEARPDLPHDMESDLEEVVRFLVSVNWPFRLHATYGESIERELTVFEKIAKEENNMDRFKSLHWFIDHAETISQHEIARINALGGGIAIQHRMAFQGEYFIQRYGAEAASQAPPIHAIKQGGVPLGGGTDGTRVATYNPWISLYWLATGRTTGGTDLTSHSSTGTANKLSREEALHLWTHANTWFIKEEQTRGLLQPGYVADLTVLNTDFFSCSEDSMKSIESLLTIVNGRIVYAHPSIENEFNSSHVQPTPHPHVIPEWSPVNYFGGYQLHGSTAWKPVETTNISTTNDEYKTNPHQSLQQGSQSTINLVDPSKFFEHGHDC